MLNWWLNITNKTKKSLFLRKRSHAKQFLFFNYRLHFRKATWTDKDCFMLKGIISCGVQRLLTSWRDIANKREEYGRSEIIIGYILVSVISGPNLCRQYLYYWLTNCSRYKFLKFLFWLFFYDLWLATITETWHTYRIVLSFLENNKTWPNKIGATQSF